MKFKIIFIFLVAIFLSGCAVKRDGTVNISINDCNEVINIKENSFQAFFKDFTCEYNKNKDEKIYGGTCYSFDMKNNKCLRVYIYEASSQYNCPEDSEATYNGCTCNNIGYIFINNRCIKESDYCNDENANYSINENKCICKEGFELRNDKCLSYTEICKNSFGDNVVGEKDKNNKVVCYCNSGYVWKDDNKTSCIKLECDENSKIVTIGNILNYCQCNDGFIKDDKTDKCIYTTCKEKYGENSIKTIYNRCECNIGFIKDDKTDKCVLNINLK